MKTAVLIVRTLMGLGFAFLAATHFLKLYAPPAPELTPAAASFMTALGPTGYFDVVKALELSGGVLLLTGLFAPLGLVLLTPVIVNIALFDILLMQKFGLGVPLLAMALFLIWAYRPYFASVFTFNAKPAGCC
jgi:putative oxidoreductase